MNRDWKKSLISYTVSEEDIQNCSPTGMFSLQLEFSKLSKMFKQGKL